MPSAIGRILVDPELAFLDGCWEAAPDLFVDRGRLTATPTARGAMLDARGLVVMHAFIDTHIHGVGRFRFWGHDSTSGYVANIAGAARLLPRHGVCAFAPTSITEQDGGLAMLSATAQILSAREGYGVTRGARVLGAHAEGPFLNPDFIGAHTVESAQAITPESLSTLFCAADGSLLIVTGSPSLAGFEALTTAAAENGVVVQIGHDRPTRAEFQHAVEAGVRGVTHLFNAMGGLSHRHDDFAAMALTCEQLHLELILNPSFVSRSWLVHAIQAAPDRVVGVSDCVGHLIDLIAFNGTDLMPGEDGVWVRRVDSATWANTVHVSRHLSMLIDAGLDWVQLSRLLSLNAIHRIGLDMGCRPGDLANLVCLDVHGNVVATVVCGNLEWLTDHARLTA